MKKYKFSFIALFVCIMLSTCRPKIVTDVKVPKTDPQLVLFSFLSPEDTVIEVVLTISNPVFGTTYYYQSNIVNDAYVTISNSSGQIIQIPFNSDLGKYRISQSAFTIVPSQTYTITASSKGLLAMGTTSVPKSIINFDKVSGKLGSNSSQGDPMVVLNYSWQDEAAIKNYYRISFEDNIRFNGVDSSGTPIGDEFFKDINRDGNLISGQYEYDGYFDPGTEQRVNLYLLNTDIHYYEYHSRRVVYSGDDPFSEPFQQYSNVTSGLGVVCSYRLSKSSCTF